MKKRCMRILLISILSAICLLPVFAQTGGLKGKVRTNSGSGIAKASVTVRQDGKDVKSVRADAKGNFVMEGLDSGNYNLVVDAKGYSSGLLYNVEVKKKKLRDLGDRLILSIDQGTQVIVKGSVFYREGTSVTGAKIEIEKVNADGSTQSLGSVFTNVSGEFTVRRPEGPAKLRVTAKFKGVSGTKEIEVENAAVYRLAITLDLPRTEK
ncbi:MAG: carboxypeptidase regulatory-like domain-containing protein [Pyrinomonadaceae bacterium]|nr:carboxypeptidase regulatory-like domain-containing protein [Blastocatellia bacterium]MDQ3219299.1 carboxypeptidase regulatory-like domain-containing protein [Acidobacteriota bacterium]MDQ3490062.1 carboxypeptidase regulatory-like domain-containing protein [Acidobacteriota bacterium]